MNIWLLTEEKPKASTIKSILNIYKNDFGGEYNYNSEPIVIPQIKDNSFEFLYIVKNIQVNKINNIYIKIVSGESSFLDFLFYIQENEPNENSNIAPLFGVEETKTRGDESRNTNAFQRGTKFIYFRHFFPNTPAYMLYNDEHKEKNKKPTDSEIFGTRAMMTLGIKYIGKNMVEEYTPFNTIDELITAKNSMRKPPKGNVPVRLKKDDTNNTIYISGTLSKPKEKGNIGHDPNIGCLSIISGALRFLGWNGKIIITESSVKQKYIDKNKDNKFLYICELLKLGIDGVDLYNYYIPTKYWHYEKSSEKVASILFHILCENAGLQEVYQNHAGCERGYFKSKNGELYTIPKYCGEDSTGKVIALDNKKTPARNIRDLLIPDVIIQDESNKIIYLIEGKKYTTLNKGLKEIEDYNDIEDTFIKKHYADYDIRRYLTIFGGNLNYLPHDKVLLYLNDSGKIIMNSKAEPNLSRKILSI